MSNRASYDKDIFNAIDILRSYGFNGQQGLDRRSVQSHKDQESPGQLQKQIPTLCITLCRK